MPSADSLILCYDGSEDAKYAITAAGALFPRRQALVLTVWQPLSSVGSVAWSGATAVVNHPELDRAAAERGGEIAAEGVALARAASLEAEPLAIETGGPIWEAIVEIAKSRGAAVVVMGSRGLTGLRSVLLGSVSSAVVHQAACPILVIPRSDPES